jgi:ribosomal protein S18 acetylase RimI-like enzyme
MRVKLATKTDIPAVASLLARSFLEYKTSYPEKTFAATISTMGELHNRLTEGPVWVAVEGETVVGTVSGVLDGETLHIRSLAVSPGNRGQGLGKMLLDQAEDYAYKKGYWRLVLSTTPFLTSAIRLYERCGFRRSNEGPTDRLGTPIFTMTKQLRKNLTAQNSRDS